MVLGLGCVAACLVPPVVFLWVALDSGLGTGPALAALADQYGAARQSLLVTTGLGLVPIGFLGFVLLAIRRAAGKKSSGKGSPAGESATSQPSTIQPSTIQPSTNQPSTTEGGASTAALEEEQYAHQVLGRMAVAGLVPILAVVAWIHLDYWSLFLPERVYPGFPHGLGFVVGPFFFAPIASILGLLAARVAGALRP